MLLNELFEATVIPFDERKTVKAKKSFKDKMADLVASFSEVSNSQKKGEEFVKKSMNELKKARVSTFKKHLLEIPYIAKEYQPTTTVPEMLYYTLTSKEDHKATQMAKDLFKKIRKQLVEFFEQEQININKIKDYIDDSNIPEKDILLRDTKIDSFEFDSRILLNFFDKYSL